MVAVLCVGAPRNGVFFYATEKNEK